MVLKEVYMYSFYKLLIWNVSLGDYKNLLFFLFLLFINYDFIFGKYFSIFSCMKRK